MDLVLIFYFLARGTCRSGSGGDAQAMLSDVGAQGHVQPDTETGVTRVFHVFDDSR